MFKKLSGSLLIALAVLLAFTSCYTLFTLNTTTEKIKNAVLVKDGVPRPENEGKLVMLLVDPNQISGAYDDQLYLSFDSPCVRRLVEKLTLDPSSGEDLLWKWTSVSPYAEDELKEELLIGSMEGAAFKVSPELFKGMPANQKCTLDMFKEEEVDNLQKYVQVIPKLDEVYFSEAPSFCFVKEPTGSNMKPYEGARRVHYRVLDTSKHKAFAWIGIQENGVLKEDATLGSASFFNNQFTPEEAAHEHYTMTIGGIVLVLFFAALSFFFGLRSLRRAKKLGF